MLVSKRDSLAFHSMRNLFYCFVILSLASVITGCSILITTIDTMPKQPVDDGQRKAEIKTLAGIVNSIPTRYKLTGEGPSDQSNLDSLTLQNSLFKAARFLMYQDRGADDTSILDQVCFWFAEMG